MLNKIKYTVLIAFIIYHATFLVACAGAFGAGNGINYLYSYTLREASTTNDLVFRDNYIFVQFKLDESAIRFQLQNISETQISIDWEKASIGINNRVYPVRNSSTLYNTNPNVPASLNIPPLGYVRDMIIPRDNISFQKNTWVEKEFFPTNDRGSSYLKKLIPRYVKSQILLNLPIKVGEITTNYSFTFAVNKITPLAPNVLLPVKDRPPVPPASAKTVENSQSLLPILISGGVLVVAVYLLSQKKSTAGEL